MKTPVNSQLRLEVAKFRLAFTCESCAHYEPDSQACANGYPNAAHRNIQLDRAELEFCKEFELS